MLCPGTQLPVRQTQPPPPPPTTIPIVSSWEGDVCDRPAGPILLPFYFPAAITCPQIQFPEAIVHLQSLAIIRKPRASRRQQERKWVSEPRAAAPAPSPSCPLSLFMINNDGYSCQALRLPGQAEEGGAASHTFLTLTEGATRPLLIPPIQQILMSPQQARGCVLRQGTQSGWNGTAPQTNACHMEKYREVLKVRGPVLDSGQGCPL